MAEQYAAATKRRFDELGKRIQPLALGRPSLRLDLLLNSLAGPGKVLCCPEQPRFRRLAVAPGASGLLVISLDALGDRGMCDEADVGLVDAHSERHSRGDHHLFRSDERSLVAEANLRVEAGIVRGALAGPSFRVCSAIFSALSRLGA